MCQQLQDCLKVLPYRRWTERCGPENIQLFSISRKKEGQIIILFFTIFPSKVCIFLRGGYPLDSQLNFIASPLFAVKSLHSYRVSKKFSLFLELEVGMTSPKWDLTSYISSLEKCKQLHSSNNIIQYSQEITDSSKSSIQL